MALGSGAGNQPVDYLMIHCSLIHVLINIIPQLAERREEYIAYMAACGCSPLGTIPYCECKSDYDTREKLH